MTLIEGIEHLNFLSEDLDRLAGFYERVFEPRSTARVAGFRPVSEEE